LYAVYKIFRYLQATINRNISRIVFDGARKDMTDESIFVCSVTDLDDWNDFYPEDHETLPGRHIEPLRNPVHVRAYVDEIHAGNMANRRSHTRSIMYINSSLVVWYSKRQNTVECLSFRSEYTILRIATDIIEALRYKLRKFESIIDGVCNVFCDNKSVVTNSSVPSSVLNKRHNALCYHKVRED